MKIDNRHYEMLVEHLPYEVDMMRSAHAFVLGDEHYRISGSPFLRNAAIECFWLHARNLLEFFRRQSHQEGRTAAAQDFTNPGTTYNLPFDELEDQINEQICHIQYDRHRDPGGDKLGGYDMQRVKEALDRAIQNFEANLRSDAIDLWTKKPATKIEFPSDIRFTATNAINVVQSGPSNYKEELFTVSKGYTGYTIYTKKAE